jgi:hypothetical protein
MEELPRLKLGFSFSVVGFSDWFRSAFDCEIDGGHRRWIIVKIGNSMLNNGNAATCAAIYLLE